MNLKYDHTALLDDDLRGIFWVTFSNPSKQARYKNTLDVAPSQDASDHQDHYILIGNPNLNLYLPLLLGATPTFFSVTRASPPPQKNKTFRLPRWEITRGVNGGVTYFYPLTFRRHDLTRRFPSRAKKRMRKIKPFGTCENEAKI